MERSRNQYCDGNATVRSLCIVDLHVADNTVECCHSNPGHTALHCCCAAEYYALLSVVQKYVVRNVKCPFLTRFGVSRQVFVQVPNIAFGKMRPVRAALMQVGRPKDITEVIDAFSLLMRQEAKGGSGILDRPAAGSGCVGPSVVFSYFGFTRFQYLC